MTIIPVLIDDRPAYLQRPGAPPSLLLTPLGTGCVLDALHRRAAEMGGEALTIATAFEPQTDYQQRVRQTGHWIDSIGPLERLEHLLAHHEPSDWLLILDPRCFPVDARDLRELQDDLSDARAARHLVALENGRQGTKEYIQLDELGGVRRIQRYYEGVTWLQAGMVACSLIPISALRATANVVFHDLRSLRQALSARGVVSRDIGLSARAFDLAEERGLLQLHEHVLRELACGAPPPGYTAAAPGVWVGPRCTVDPAARLYGPVVLQEGTTLEAKATVIGPAVVGANSRVQREAILAQCLVASGSVVPAGCTAHYRFLCGDDRNRPTPAPDPLDRVAQVHRSSASAGVGGDVPTMAEGVNRRRPRYETTKRVVDGVVALLGLLALSPLLLLTALMIKLTSRGPVFFTHVREGKGGRTFRCCKFRTMVVGAHDQQRALYRQNQVDGPQFKLKSDPRITRVGQWLRMANIDELPQLFNLVLGQMSLIGPRPSPFRENQICVPWRQARLSVRPGITGLWQICRHERSAGDFHQWIYYDMLYVRHLSFWLDIKILAATLLTFGGRLSVPLRWMIPIRQLREDQDSLLAAVEPAVRVVYTAPAGRAPDRVQEFSGA